MLILRKKYYSDEEGGGMSTGKKVALGLGGLALGFAGARRGMLGTSTALGANKLWAKAGQSLGSQGMINSAASNYAKAAVGAKNSAIVANGGTAASKMTQGREAVRLRNKFKNQFKLPSSTTQATAQAPKFKVPDKPLVLKASANNANTAMKPLSLFN